MKEQKICKVCGKLKNLEEFVVSQANSDGRKSRCKPCTAIISKQWRKDNEELNRAIQKKYHENVRKPRLQQNKINNVSNLKTI